MMSLKEFLSKYNISEGLFYVFVRNYPDCPAIDKNKNRGRGNWYYIDEKWFLEKYEQRQTILNENRELYYKALEKYKTGHNLAKEVAKYSHRKDTIWVNYVYDMLWQVSINKSILAIKFGDIHKEFNKIIKTIL